MSTLGFNGRFANQVFQYAFLKLQARKHQLRAETPPWIGQFLFGHDDPPVSRSLPMVVEKRDKLNHARPQITNQTFRNVDIWGYFQYHTSFYSPHKDFFRSLFQPSPAVEEKLLPAMQRLRGLGRTVIGIHLRRGDYGYGHFFIAPTQWYLEWLEELWPRQDDPVLFLASDEPEKVRGDFSRFNPVTARDLGCELPEAEFYPDFYLLSKCDLLAISNSSFSFAASMLNRECRLFMRPHLPSEKLLPYDPWSADPLLVDATVEGSGMKTIPAQKQEPASLDTRYPGKNRLSRETTTDLVDMRILYSQGGSSQGVSGPGFSRQEKVLGPGPGQMIPGQCGPEMEKELSTGGSSRSFDVGDRLHRSFPGWEPDLFIARIDGSTEVLPRNVEGLKCPGILVLGEIHPEKCPFDRMIEYARSEKFDFYICDQSRLQLRLFHLAGLENLYWLPGIFHYPPKGGIEEEDFENREFNIDYFRNKAIHAGTFEAETQSRGARLLSKLEDDFDNFWYGNLSPKDSLKAFSQAEISINIGLENNFFPRILEIIGSGGFLLTERPGDESGLELLFNQGEHYHIFKGIPDLRAKINQFLSHPEEARNCRAKAHIRYLEEFHPVKTGKRLHRLIETGEIEDVFSPGSLAPGKHFEGFKPIAARVLICHLLNKLHRKMALVKVFHDSSCGFCDIEDFLALPFTRISLLNSGGTPENAFPFNEKAEYKGRIEFLDERSSNWHIFAGNSFDLGTLTVNENEEYTIIYAGNSDIQSILAGLNPKKYRYTLEYDSSSGIKQLHVRKNPAIPGRFPLPAKLSNLWKYFKRN